MSKKAIQWLYDELPRLVKEARPAGILAFDFGPPSQVLAPGFTAITWNNSRT